MPSFLRECFALGPSCPRGRTPRANCSRHWPTSCGSRADARRRRTYCVRYSAMSWGCHKTPLPRSRGSPGGMRLWKPTGRPFKLWEPRRTKSSYFCPENACTSCRMYRTTFSTCMGRGMRPWASGHSTRGAAFSSTAIPRLSQTALWRVE